MEENTDNKSLENDLVVYTPNQLGFSGVARKIQTPLSELNPENRIVSNGEMYAAGFCELKIEPEYVRGIAYVRYLEKIKKQSENLKDSSLTERIATKIFGEFQRNKVDDWNVVQLKEEKYRQQWCVKRNESLGNPYLFHYYKPHNKFEPQNFIGELKVKISEQEGILLSNNFLHSLFNPLIFPIEKIYREMAEF